MSNWLLLIEVTENGLESFSGLGVMRRPMLLSSMLTKW